AARADVSRRPRAQRCRCAGRGAPRRAATGAGRVSGVRPMRRMTLRTAESCRRLAALISTFVLTACGAVANAQVAAGQDALLGVWVPGAAPERLLTVAGEPPPLNAEAARVHAARLERLAAGDTSFDQATWCASPGMPRAMTMP